MRPLTHTRDERPPRVCLCTTVAAITVALLCAPAGAQTDRAPTAAPDAPAVASARGETRLQTKWERSLAAPPPVYLLRIGEQLAALSHGNAFQLSATGDERPVAGGRVIEGAGIAHDEHAAYVVGGRSSAQPTADVWRIVLGPRGLDWIRVASLPAPCMGPVVAVNGGDLFVVGAAVAGPPFFVRVRPGRGSLDRLQLPPLFGQAQSLGAQGGTLHLVGRDTAGATRHWRWKTGEWQSARTPPEELLALPPAPVGQSHLLYAVAGTTDPLLAYHTITDTWSPLPAADGGTTALVSHGNGILRALTNPGGGLLLRAETLVRPTRGLAPLDYATLAGYFVLNLGIGFLCAGRKADSDHFFRGGGRIQWWALGISYMATGMSSISFMAYPATGYASNWLLIGVPVFQSAAVILTGIVFIRMLRRLNITTVFEYLEQRFGRTIRLLGATLMILSQVGGRLSIVMLLPSMAFSAVSGLNVYVSVALMGVVTAIYCLKGGMKAVVWTDVLQFALMYGAIAVTVVTIAQDAPGGVGELVSVAYAEGKFKAWLFDWDFVQPSIWVFSCLAMTTVFLQVSDQALMQRALSAPDEKAARNSVMLGGVLTVPIAAMLFFVGSALFVFYRRHADRLDPLLPTDSILPYFVGTELAPGLVGLIIAGIFAAAMSTVSGTVNAISAIVVRDFLPVFHSGGSEATRMKVARVTTLAVGGLATGIAAVMASMNIRSLWEMFAALMALIGGGFPGIFALGLLTRRANAPGAAIGLLASIAITLAVKQYTAANVFLFTTVAVASCLGVGYAASLFFAPPARPLTGLTIRTLRPPPDLSVAGTAAPS